MISPSNSIDRWFPSWHHQKTTYHFCPEDSMVPRSLLDLVPFVLWWFSSASSRIRCSEALDQTQGATYVFVDSVTTLWPPWATSWSQFHTKSWASCARRPRPSQMHCCMPGDRHYEARELHGSSLAYCMQKFRSEKTMVNYGKLSEDM